MGSRWVVCDRSKWVGVAYVVGGWRGRIRRFAVVEAFFLLEDASEVTALQRVDVAVAVETSGLVCASGGVVDRHFCMKRALYSSTKVKFWQCWGRVWK